MDIQQVNSRIIHEEPDTQFAQEDGQDHLETGHPGGGGDAPNNGDGENNLEKHQTTLSHASFEETYPEGGTRAWLVVLGAFFALFSSMGLMNSIAMFQAYTLSHQLKGHSEGTVGWIFSIYTFLAFFGGVYFGPVFDKYGPRWLIISGATCVVLAMVAMSFCTGKLTLLLSQIYTLGSNTNSRTLALYPLLWHPRRRRHLPPLHALHRGGRPLVQAPPRLRNGPGHLRRRARRHHLPADADGPL